MADLVDLIQLDQDDVFVLVHVVGHEGLKEPVHGQEGEQALLVGQVVLDRCLWVHEVLIVVDQELDLVFDQQHLQGRNAGLCAVRVDLGPVWLELVPTVLLAIFLLLERIGEVAVWKLEDQAVVVC